MGENLPTGDFIRTHFLDDGEWARLRSRHPNLPASPDDGCPTCGGDTFYFWNDQRVDCDCFGQLQLHKHYLNAGIGVLYQRLGWDDFTGHSEQRTQAIDYLSNMDRYLRQGIGLLFMGSYGTGKTFLANLVLKELVKLGVRCWATTFATTVEMFTAGWGNRSEKEWFAEKFMNSTVLLLDDLGQELKLASNRLPQSTFNHILRTRVQEGRPTLITTNMTYRELTDGYGSSALSLLSESSLPVIFTGEDNRESSRDRKLVELLGNQTRPIF